MELPRITAPQPTEQPPVPAKTYPELYLSQMVLRTQVNGDNTVRGQSLSLLFRNYNYDLAELDPDESHKDAVVIPDIYVEAARSALVAQVMGLLARGCHLLLRERTLLEAIASAADPAVKAALEAELATVRQDLGVTV